jgi:uncharacterized repeat protein (TIGR01451 family)
LVNNASVAAPAGTTDPTPGDNTEGDTDALSRSANLGISKTAVQTQASPGDPVTYTIVVSNAGPSNSTGATVTDDLPATLQGVTWTCAASAGSSCTASGSGDIQQTVDIAAGGTLTYTVTATLSPVVSPSGSLVNTATVTAPAAVPDPAPANNSATKTLPITTRPLDLYTLVPCRLVDTRQAAGPLGGPALTSNVERTFPLAGVCGIPANARALALNVTVVTPAGTGFVQIYPAGAGIPATSVINFVPGKTRSNNAILPLGNGGGVNARSFIAGGGSVHVLVDVVGYFQ